MADMTIREWQDEYRRGMFEDGDFDTQVKAGWYDWFCNDSSLKNKTEKIAKIITGITNDWMLDNFRVWFKNNCPCAGPLYDDVRFEPMDENKRDELYFVVSIDDKREDDKYCVFTARNGYKKEAGFKSIKELKEWINGWEQEVSA